MIPCYSSYSPEDTLMFRFPPQSTVPFENQTVTEQVYNPLAKIGILFAGFCCFILIAALLDNAKWFRYDKSVAEGNASLCWEFFLMWQHFVFTDVTWMHLALPNWLETGAAKMCEQPWAVSSRHTNNVPFDSPCARSDTVQGQKACWTPCWNKEPFQKAWSNVLGTHQAGYCAAKWTSHLLVSSFVGMRLSISKDL